MKTHQLLVDVNGLSKSFDTKRIVDNVSFTVKPGEIFGLLGQNGVGKTTTLRLILNLLGADAGKIQVFGGPLNERNKDRIGYMPEERGLYSTMRVADCLVYFGTLKNLSNAQVRARTDAALKRFDLWEHRQKKISELSRGLAQKAQLIAATLHEPDLLIVDEPFANLDPVNIQLVETVLREWRAQGRAVILSSHQLRLVEMLCDRILLLHRGKSVLYGGLLDIKHQFARNEVRIRGKGTFAALPNVVAAQEQDGIWHIVLDEHTVPADWLRMIAQRDDLRIEHFEHRLPSLDEIFVQIVQEPPPSED